MMAFIRTLIIAVSLFVLSHEADAVVSDMFENATGTEMRLVPIAQQLEAQNQEYVAPEVNVMPAYTKAAKVAHVKSTIKDAFKTVMNVGRGFGGGNARVPVSISPAKL